MQDSRLLNNPREVRNRLAVDGRRLSLYGLPDFRQHTRSKRMQQRQANRPIDWAENAPEPLPLAGGSTARNLHSALFLRWNSLG